MIRKLRFDFTVHSPLRTPEDFVAELRRLRAQVGDPSFRNLHRIAGERIADAPNGHRMDPLSPSTTSEILGGKRLPRLPRLEFVESYVTACLSFHGVDGPATTAEVERWRERWHSLATREQQEEPAPVDAPRPRRPLTRLLVVVAFLAGLGVGIGVSRSWPADRSAAASVTAPAEPSTEAPDVCLAQGTTLPTGQDVLRLPPEGQQTGSWWVNDPDFATLHTDGRRFRADVVAGKSRPGDVIIVKSDVALVQGSTYALAFSASADHPTTVRVRVQDNQPPLYEWSHDQEVPVTQHGCLHLYQFVARKSSAHSELTFQVGGHDQDFRLQIQDVSLVESPHR
ncbi:carbohydrate binding domain-containing protein [Jidongwangia harbinensis]|uniref:carbohydrate binding domain-containing protein n=1 Tax=Jidongwangia harbinensis TaxID=2878561 RepID=UPI001CD93C57|nr:carbohydrate binding domain-containing protein [Jidongwangia harbinensis]MCA2218401.1 carbohydrate binding domain-containing protein [Jidongwangia harbinensis]